MASSPLKVSWGDREHSKYANMKALHEITEGDTWLAGFLRLIAEAYRDDRSGLLTPCAAAATAQKEQAAFDAQVKRARELKRDYPQLLL